MRVIAGEAGGRPLRAPPGRATRPTSDRVREALFSSLEASGALPGPPPGARALDLYAGSGALGIEALSRGAAHAVLVERDERAARVVDDNLRRTGLGRRARVVRADAQAFCRRDPPPSYPAADAEPFDLVLCDPPYAEPLPALYDLLGSLGAAGRLAAGAVVVVERDRRDPHGDAPPPGFLVPDRLRSYGDTVLRYLRYRGEEGT